MARLDGTLHRPRTLRGLAATAALVALLGILAASTSPTSAATRAGPRPVTLTFAGQVVEDEGLGPFLEGWPPIEGGVALVYTVPAGYRLVVESAYASLLERWTTSSARSAAMAGFNTSYDLGETCAYPGYFREYGIPLGEPVDQTSEGMTERRRTGDLSGPVFVEGGRSITGNVFAPGGDSELFAHIVVHGRLEPTADNPPVPVCGEP